MNLDLLNSSKRCLKPGDRKFDRVSCVLTQGLTLLDLIAALIAANLHLMSTMVTELTFSPLGG